MLRFRSAQATPFRDDLIGRDMLTEQPYLFAIGIQHQINSLRSPALELRGGEGGADR